MGLKRAKRLHIWDDKLVVYLSHKCVVVLHVGGDEREGLDNDGRKIGDGKGGSQLLALSRRHVYGVVEMVADNDHVERAVYLLEVLGLGLKPHDVMDVLGEVLYRRGCSG